MISPSVWNNTPYGSKTAWHDFVGTHALWWRSVAQQSADAGFPFRTFPLDGGRGPQWLQAVDAQYKSACAALGIAAPADLTSYDLSDEEAFASFTFLLSQEASRIRIAAGVN